MFDFTGRLADARLVLMFVALMTCGICLGYPEPARAQSIDSCLVGSWRATGFTWSPDFSVGVQPLAGGAGFLVVFKADGSEIVDYGPMQPFKWSNDTQIWRSKATFQISTDQSFAKFERVVDSSVEVKPTEVSSAAGPSTFIRGWPGPLGPGALGSTRNGGSYTCSQDTLVYLAWDALNGGPRFGNSITLTRLTPPILAPVSVAGRTWLTPTQIKDREQDLGGVWSEDSNLSWMTNSPADTFVDHPMPARDPNASSIQMQEIEAPHWEGKVYVCPVPDGTCPNLCRWVPGLMQIDAINISGVVEFYGQQSKSDCSGYTDEPYNKSIALKRFIGVSFVPILAGKYIDMIGSPGVGDQQAQFQAAVRLTANYEPLAPADVKVSADHGTLTLIDKASGTYEFRTNQSGTSELRFDVLGTDGQVFHTDRVRIEIPGIPGIGR